MVDSPYPAPVLSTEELRRFIDAEFPQVNADGEHFFIDKIEAGSAYMRLEAGERHLRPGGTISGPSMFMLADYAAFAAILAHIGPSALTVTTNLNINFMRKPEPPTLLAKGTLLKLGKRLAVVDIALSKPDSPHLIAQAGATYSIAPKPPERRQAQK